MNLIKAQKQHFIEHILKLVSSLYVDGTEATNGKLCKGNIVFDYQIEGEPNSVLLDWRSKEQMKGGKFAYSDELMQTAKEHYQMVVICDKSNPYNNLVFFPLQADASPKFSTCYLEDENIPIHIVDFTVNNPDYGKDR